MITKTFKDENELAKFLALEILRTLKRKKKLVLGCPGGRSLKKTYYFLGILSHTLKISLNNLIIDLCISEPRIFLYFLTVSSTCFSDRTGFIMNTVS